MLGVAAMTAWMAAADAQQPPSRSVRELALEQFHNERKAAREAYTEKAKATCAEGSFRYDGNSLLIRVGNEFWPVHDEIDFDEGGSESAGPVTHFLSKCDNDLKLYFIERFSYLEDRHTLLADMRERYGNITLGGLRPIVSPDSKSIISVESGGHACCSIGIVLRNQQGFWTKVWDYPPATGELDFIAWESSNRFRVAMQVINHTFTTTDRGRSALETITQRWEAVIEFSRTSFILTEGPQTITKSTQQLLPE